MLPTSRWKLRQALHQMYSERIEYIEGNLKKQRAMAGEFLDERDFAALSAMHLTMIQDEEEIEGLKSKLELLSDDASFEKAFKESEDDD